MMGRAARILRGVIVTVAALSVIAWVWTHMGRAREGGGQDVLARPEPRVWRSNSGEVVVKLTADERGLADIRVEPVAPTTWQPEVAAYGTLIEDPLESFTLRAPVTGTLRDEKAGWPGLGAVLADRAVVGEIEPRWFSTPMDVADRAAKLSEARGNVEEQEAALTASTAAYQRLKSLNDLDKNISDKSLQEALARMHSDQARLKAAREAVRLLDAPLDGRLPPMPLVLDRGGEVVELLAHPGESLESGQPIMRVARFDRMLARVNLIMGESLDASAPAARVVVLGHEDHPLAAHRLSLSQAVDPRTLGQAVLLSVAADGFGLVPGQAVSAYLPAPGAAQRGVLIPRSAVVRYQGRQWVYVEEAENAFTRRAVTLEHNSPQGCFCAGVLEPGDRVVVVGAQTLLSEDLNSQYDSRAAEGD